MNKNRMINLFLCNKALLKLVFGAIVLFALSWLAGCSGDESLEEYADGGESSFTMKFRAGSDSALLNNTQIYVFTSGDVFVKRQLNVTKVNNTLSTNMSVGTWNLMLLTCDTDIAGDIIPPYGGNSSYPMWRTKLIAPANLFLSQTPAELRYDSLKNTVILEDQLTTRNAVLNRNVAKIQVILNSYTGFDPITSGQNSLAYVDLLDVPTTLNWRGEYYPSKNSPEHSGDKPIREFLNFDASLKADTVNFIIPAHRGADAFDAQHNDTTTHKLRLRMSMPLNGVSYFGRSPVEISFVPKVNRIIQLNVNFRGEPETNLDVKVTVKDWEDVIVQEKEFD